MRTELGTWKQEFSKLRIRLQSCVTNDSVTLCLNMYTELQCISVTYSAGIALFRLRFPTQKS
jgi:hypothetical protein